jgi:hypothetical protein
MFSTMLPSHPLGSHSVVYFLFNLLLKPPTAEMNKWFNISMRTVKVVKKP